VSVIGDGATTSGTIAAPIAPGKYGTSGMPSGMHVTPATFDA